MASFHLQDPPIIQISDSSERVDPLFLTPKDVKLFTPGQVVTTESGLLRGRGTYADEEAVKTSVSGISAQVNKLIEIRPVKNRYVGQIGDVVVGRVIELQQKRWKVDINYRLHASLQLTSIHLPGGELRKREAEDERLMRKYFNEGDLISAEVQNIFSDGSLFLHTRSLKYGKLTNGLLINVFPALIKRCKTHFLKVHGMRVILGNNGLIWIQSSVNEDEMGGFTKNMQLEISLKDCESLVRLKSCIYALANSRLLIYDTSMNNAFEASLKYELHELVKPDVMLDIAISSQPKMDLQ